MTFLLDYEDVGHVELNLSPEKTFNLDVEILITAQIEIEGDITDDIEGVEEKHTGKWEIVDNNFVLTFDDPPGVNSLFNPRIDPYETVKIIDEYRISFDKDIDLITVRGVYCKRIK